MIKETRAGFIAPQNTKLLRYHLSHYVDKFSPRSTTRAVEHKDTGECSIAIG
jgi:hypothetical protein